MSDSSPGGEDPGGMLIAVVGPSGAGKDSLMSYARERLAADPAVLFVRRVVTRPAAVAAEDHDTLPLEAFLASEAEGRFAVTWQAHGLHYAIPASVHGHLERGGVAVVNGSRAALPAICSAFGRVTVAEITCRPDILAARLAARGREDPQRQMARLARTVPAVTPNADRVEIDNSGEIAAAGNALTALIRSFREPRAP